MKQGILILTIAALISGCCKRPIYHTTYTSSIDTTKTVKEVVRYVDTVLTIDSTVTIVHYHCDSLKNIVLDTFWALGTKASSMNRRTSIKNIGNGLFEFKCAADSLRLVIAVKDKTIETLIKKSEKIDTVVEKKPTFWELLKRIGWHILYIVVLILCWEFVFKTLLKLLKII